MTYFKKREDKKIPKKLLFCIDCKSETNPMERNNFVFNDIWKGQDYANDI
ncbi:hypothetical protein R3W88_029234 [Solanum pinnatisectum]|uniref:Uncharacterized protein n=1 Tax=Solanum pinnatisectum TaxID=50273 RepID=A0AAV9K505_9SOLN|nr:hypothetical protein R3W88_029234 [Solanum pinnatisectum]